MRDILVNGNPFGFFSSSHGLRKGDPLSPFLFVIVVEALSRIPSATTHGGFLSGFLWGLGTLVWLTFHTCCLHMTLWFFVGPDLTTFAISMLYF